MKIRYVVIGMICLIIFSSITVFIIFRVNYKTFEEIQSLLKKGTDLKNVYAKVSMRFPKDEKDPDWTEGPAPERYYWKDNNLVIVYNNSGPIFYEDFNNSIILEYIDGQEYELSVNINYQPKFNEHLKSVDKEWYNYLFAWFCNGQWCDIIAITKEESKDIYFINSKTGLLVKRLGIGSNSKGDFISFECDWEYELDAVTDKNMQKPPIID